MQASAAGNVSRPSRGSADAFVGASAVKVGRGDTVYELSRRHRVPVPAIIRANNLKPPYLLNVGQRIELPRGTQHTVTPGDTLYSIAQRYDAGMYELARLNGIDAPYTVRIGEVLVIPQNPDAPKSQPVAKAAPRTETASAPAKPDKPPRQMARAPEPASTGGSVNVVPPRKPPSPVPPPAARTGRGFVWPVRGPLMSNFGTKNGGLRNDGINIIAPAGTPVVAAENGVVAYAGNEIRGFGNLLLIKHADGYVTAYAHNRDLLVKRGQRVKRGQKIATVGQTGSVNRPQLHFEIRKGRRPRNPEDYLKKA
ncbi:MAG: LysM peptidoglycan-binding domain-containing M23 family metallopeptidase [Rhodospirillales bacterium]|nr:LysM peptidoglycan-binding domain-containing M23 family metallopeptidase [Rhodospirillales bacterium]MBO6786487.1 LysM peptidoglycan-binding domain-containing M23 family metallopeptidase [Rhodospirillales bacterium]